MHWVIILQNWYNYLSEVNLFHLEDVIHFKGGILIDRPNIIIGQLLIWWGGSNIMAYLGDSNRKDGA
jgi:hypothetical protein